MPLGLEGSSCTVTHLDWHSSLSSSFVADRQFDVVIGSDVIYYKRDARAHRLALPLTTPPPPAPCAPPLHSHTMYMHTHHVTCVYTCMDACMHACVYGWIYVCMHVYLTSSSSVWALAHAQGGGINAYIQTRHTHLH